VLCEEPRAELFTAVVEGNTVGQQFMSKQGGDVSSIVPKKVQKNASKANSDE
jgi:hypothetical protein